jgi:hypothetical protein
MKTIAHSNIAKRLSTMFAVVLAGAVIAGSITPAMAGKHGGGGGGGGNWGKHSGGWGKNGGGHHGHPSKPPQNPGPIGPLPRPQSQPLPKPVPVPPVVVRDHRTPVVVRDHRTPTGGGVKVSDTPVIRDHRKPAPVPVVRDHRAPAPVATSSARPRTTTVKVAGVKVLSVKTKGKACVGSYCL